MTTPISLFDSNGVDVGKSSRSMTYLMGISDFFAYVFEDQDVVNLMLECNALYASEIYSKFLQLTSTLSLETIQTTLGVSIKLVFLGDDNKLDDVTYSLDRSIVSAQYIANAPLFPTLILENGIGFELEQGDTSTIIRLSRPLTDPLSSFSQRILSDGTTQYALWLVDAIVDEQLMSQYYGNLIGEDLSNSSDIFTNFIYGLYYLYNNGPTLSNMQKGANLVLGIPLARAHEQVIDIRNYLDSNQYLVLTDQNQYLLPAGIPTNVVINQQLQPGDLLGLAIQIEDYKSNGTWWTGLSIPSNLIPVQPPSQPNRFAAPGTTYWNIMNTYLYPHAFLVKINVGAFQNTGIFDKLANVIIKAKPSYTQPVYTWAIDVNTGVVDTYGLVESNFVVTPITPGDLLEINFEEINSSEING